MTDVFPFLHQGEDSADKPETSANVNSKPSKSDAEQTVELLAKIVDEVKLDQRLPNQGKNESSKVVAANGITIKGINRLMESK